MKVKFSKKLLSVILAALMVVTSVPIIGFVAFAEDNALEDPAITEIKNAMDRFETQLATPGMFTNVDVAYDAYVDCQEAMDAYTYGGESNALNGKAAALNTAIDNIKAFTGVSGNARPSFEGDDPKSVDATYGGSYGTTYQNILYTTQTTSANEKSSGKIGDVYHRVYYPSETTLLYDGSTDALMPVMGMASVSAKKDRYIYTSYPSASTSDSSDNPNFILQGYWHDRSGESLDFAWSWQGSTNGPGYSSSVLGDTSHRSSKLDYNTNWIGIFQSGKTKYIANVMKYTGTPASTYSEYELAWYVTSGEDPNSDSGFINAAGNKIIVVNYKTLLDAVAAAGSKMKAVDLAQFTEGGLIEYIDAMEAATDFDPNVYFTSGNDYEGCSNAIAAAAQLVTTAPVDKVNSTDYASLRTAMSSAVMNTYKGGNTGYTDGSWSVFAEAYEKAQEVMATVNDNGYANPTGAAAAATALTDAFGKLELNITRVDVTEIMNIIDTFESYNSSYFTADSYANVTEEVNLAKTDIWGSLENYGVATALPEDTPENQEHVNRHIQQLQDAIKKLVLSSSAVVAISNGHRYSLVEAYSLADGLNPTDYSNYGQFSTAINSAKAYEAGLASTEFTDLDTELAEYTTYVDAIVKAYESLEYSFTRIPDGTTTGVVQTSINTLDQHRNNNGYNYYLDFSYPTSATVIRTSHDAKTVTYGQADTTFRINIDNNIGMGNNALDSITISGTADANGSVATSGAFTGTPPGLSAEQKATYAGSLTNGDFSLTNFRIVDMVNNAPAQLATTANGTAINERYPSNDEYTQILATTEGSNSYPIQGGIFVKPSKTGDASVTLSADMNYSFPSTTKPAQLTASTVPTKNSYTFSGYFGAVYSWNVQPSSQYAGYGYMTSKSNNQFVSSTVNVVDISNLVDLVDMCNGLMSESNKYTELSWSNFLDQLQAAQANLNYGSMSANTILTNVVTRYNNLWNAYSQLEVKDINVTFAYKNASGEDTTQVFTVKYGETLNEIASDIQAISTPEYTADNYTYTFKEWSSALDYNTPVTGDVTYTATYDSVLNVASWDNYIQALKELRDAVSVGSDVLVTTDKLLELQAIFDLDTTALTYYKLYINNNYSDIYADQQEAIDAEAEYIRSLKPADEDYIDIGPALATSMNDDPDQYDAQVIEELKDNLTQTITIGKNTYEGVPYVDQDALDDAVTEALEASMEYNVYVNGTDVGVFDYGTVVTVDGTGQVITDGVTPTDETFAWTGCYGAPSLGSNDADPEVDYNTSTEKYLTNDSTYTFVVKGDTYLTAKASSDPEYSYKITYMFGQKIVSIDYTDADGKFTVMDAPNYAFYKFTGYSSGYEAGQEYTVANDTVIRLNYVVDSNATNYRVLIFNSYSDFCNDYTFVFPAEDSEENYVAYNELVTADATEVDDFYCWAEIDDEINVYEPPYTLKVMSYDKVYSFYASEELTLVALTKSDIDLMLAGTYLDTYGIKHNNFVIYPNGTTVDTGATSASVRAQENLVPIYNENGMFEKFSIIGTFAEPAGYTVVEKGFIINIDPATDVTAEDLVVTNESENIKRVKVIHLTCGDQFVLNVSGLDQDTPIDYRAYAVVEDSNGNRTTIYSNFVENVNAIDA